MHKVTHRKIFLYVYVDFNINKNFISIKIKNKRYNDVYNITKTL